MVNRFFTSVLALLVGAVAQAQSVSSAVSSRSYSGTVHSAPAVSGFSSRPSMSYASSARYSSSHSSSSSNRFSGSGYRSYGSSSPARSYTPADGRTPSFGEAVMAPSLNGYQSLEADKYALAPIPKTVPFTDQKPQRGDYVPYGGGNGSGGGGVLVNPFYTPGFSSGCTVNDGQDYQLQFMNFVQGRSLYGLPWKSWVGRRYIYWNYWRSNLRFMCQDAMQRDLAHAVNPAQVVQVMRSYYRCLSATNRSEYYNLFYPESGGWGW